MLPPAFCALAGMADNAKPNPATRNIRASALERIAAFIDIPSDVSSVRYSGSSMAAVRLSGIAVAGKTVRKRRMKSRRINTFAVADRAVSRAR